MASVRYLFGQVEMVGRMLIHVIVMAILTVFIRYLYHQLQKMEMFPGIRRLVVLL